MVGLNASTNVYSLIVGSRGYSKTFPTAYSIYGGINVDFFFPRIHERFFLNTGAFYLKAAYEVTNSHTFDNLGNNDDFTADYYATESLSQFKLPFGLGYSFPEKKFTPIIKGGLSLNFLLSHSSFLQVSYDRYNQVHYDDVFIDPYSFPSNSLGYWFGFGLETKLSQRFNALIDLRYEKATATNIQLMFGITF